MSNANVSFQLRDKKTLNKTAIQCKLRYDYNTVTISTKKSIEPKHWSDAKKKVNSTCGNIASREINSQLRNIKETVEEVFYDFVRINKRDPLPEEIKKIAETTLHGCIDDKSIPKDFYGFFSHFIEMQKNTISRSTQKKISNTTILGYKNTIKKLKDFEKVKDFNVSFENIDMVFYYAFVEYLEELNLSTNTIGRQIKILKTVLNDATSEGVNKNLKFKGKKFIVLKEESDEIYLNDDELNDLIELDLSNNKRLDKAKDLFILLCFTGQRYQSLKDIVNPKNRDEQFIYLTQGKEHQKVIIPILTPVRNIFNKYKDLEVLSNVKLNLYIKEVAKLVPCLNKEVDIKTTKGGTAIIKSYFIYELVCTHTGRRSFATNFYKKNIYPLHQLMAITGHKKESTFFTYIRTTPDEHAISFLDTYNKANSIPNGNLKIVI